ncbi:PREDICTED: phosphatidate phosphatase PAH1-like isoform X3 [Nelumbo nucifera]|uniref:phosphatidate phosphatase n=1 Tax=Nelumbo nucifera TaxID=4432 RepID=A0A1U8Q478_NELNU|nr:PREDICTED: phosphatidate phosphatase PAH1-like isoform X3 [Nelumbo nucifera]
MNVVGKVGSLISQGVYSVATPFHPFGGAVDVIVVEQQDGTYRSTPWYVRFGKFQGVLKGAEKVVRISVNGVEADFHMFLDNSGEAYFIREVVSGKDSNIDGVLKDSDASEIAPDDANNNNNNNNNNNDSGSVSDDNRINLCIFRNKSTVSNAEEVQFSVESVSLSINQIENGEADDEKQPCEPQDQRLPGEGSVGSSGYRGYHYESLDHVEDVVESQGSDSEVVLVSVDGHVLTAPFSSEEATDDVQLSTPQFHLGPGEGSEFNGDNEEIGTSEDAWAADYLSDTDASESITASSGFPPVYDNSSGHGHLNEVFEVSGEYVNRTQETCHTENVEGDEVGGINREIFGSCLELSELTLHIEDADSRDAGSIGMKLMRRKGCEDSEENSPFSLPAEGLSEGTGDLKVENGAEFLSPSSDSRCNINSHDLSIEIKNFKDNSMEIENSGGMSVHSLNKNPGWEDEQLGLAAEAQNIQSGPGRPECGEVCSKSEVAEPQKETHSSEPGVQIRSGSGMGFEISLCGNLLHAGMGLGPAGEAFDAHCISEEEFKSSSASIIKNENLVIRFKQKYLLWDKAAPLIVGMAAFGLDLPVEPKDTIPVDQETPKPKEETPETTSSPSGRRWRLWPIPFRRVKTLQHASSSSSNEEVFVDSESGLRNPHAQPSQTSSGGSDSPHKQLLRTNVPTTEQIASLNLKEGQNVVTFSFCTRVLGIQQVDAHIYLWKWNTRIVISDVDGTITKSDVLGQFMPLVGKDWTQSGVARLFSAIKENGYQLLFLSARAIVQAYLTRSFLLNLKQDGKALPNGPVVISPDGLFPSLYREGHTKKEGSNSWLKSVDRFHLHPNKEKIQLQIALEKEQDTSRWEQSSPLAL